MWSIQSVSLLREYWWLNFDNGTPCVIILLVNDNFILLIVTHPWNWVWPFFNTQWDVKSCLPYIYLNSNSYNKSAKDEKDAKCAKEANCAVNQIGHAIVATILDSECALYKRKE